ncbi:MAG TPA: septal ring lytic transglycosylase RlpA family protein [Candidatus Limnocylindrales bacterium]
MRRNHVVASVALTAILATVAVPGLVGSRSPRPVATVDPGLFHPVEIATLSRGTAMTTQPQDPGVRSAGYLDHRSILIEPDLRSEPTPAPVRPAQPVARAGSVRIAPKAGTAGITGGWHHDNDISWFGPGLYGNGTACGQKMTKTLVGVAHRTLPCGTRVTFRYKGVTLTVPVVDRGPFVAGRTWDLTHGACAKLRHCFTGSIDWKLGGG